jgi:hypothetical protein
MFHTEAQNSREEPVHYKDSTPQDDRMANKVGLSGPELSLMEPKF